MTLARIPTWFFAASSVVLGIIASLAVAVAFSTASLHFGYCGPSDLSSSEQYCRGPSQLLIAGYALFLVAALLAGVTIWLRLKRRAGSNHSSQPAGVPPAAQLKL
jgi:hypothetical protein